jgi:hypothetical protein
MNNIEKTKNCQNMAGCKALFFIPLEEISSITSLNENTKRLVPLVGSNWAFFDLYEIGFTSKPDNDYFSYSISGTFRDKENKNRLFSKMKNKRFVLKLIDNNNVPWLIGTLEEPMHFTFEYTSGKNPKQDKSYSIEFFGDTTISPYLIEN